MTPRIEIIQPKKLVGQQLSMSINDNQTGQLWGAFASKIKDIPHRVATDKISLQVYPTNYFRHFNPNTPFVKWALVEVTNFENTPNNLEKFDLEGGLHAVFDYKGASNDSRIFEYIYNTWLPHSEYQLDDRPHFEVLGEKYKNNDPNSEEEIWIPVKKK